MRTLWANNWSAIPRRRWSCRWIFNVGRADKNVRYERAWSAVYATPERDDVQSNPNGRMCGYARANC